MDLLCSLNIDSLPEQQTRTCHPNIATALSSNPDVRLGFDVCLLCAKTLSTTAIPCKRCNGRVKYCSESCRREDATAPNDLNGDDEEDEEELLISQPAGHSGVVCALLRLCDADEEIDEKYDPNTAGGKKKKKKKKKVKSKHHSNENDDEAEDRVRSEYESYPATLSNVIMDGESYSKMLVERKGSLTIHVVGASQDAELWKDGCTPCKGGFCDAYIEALADLAESYPTISIIHLVFVGPDCPILEKESRVIKRTADESNNDDYRVVFETHQGDYDKIGISAPQADVVIFFNPGFTCQYYNWEEALACVKPGTPFLVTTNTEMEAILDCQFLFERKFIPALPQVVAEMIMAEQRTGDEQDNNNNLASLGADDSKTGMFFGVNPFSGSRVRQSANMANDLFVKNRWMFGGHFGSPDDRALDQGNHDRESETRKSKKRKVKGSGNSKKKNPALV